jgi:serine/threonine protein kinase
MKLEHVAGPIRSAPDQAGHSVPALQEQIGSPLAHQGVRTPVFAQAELDAAWAAKPLNCPFKTIAQHWDPGGEPLDRLVGRPMDTMKFLHIAIPLVSAIGQMHERGLIHKDIKPANVLVDAATGKRMVPGSALPPAFPASARRPSHSWRWRGRTYMAPEQTG